MREYQKVHVGIAVASDQGLLVATLRDVDIRSIGQIARETRALAERFRTTQATQEELSGGTFTGPTSGCSG